MTSFWDQNAQQQQILSQSEPPPEGKCRGGIRETSSQKHSNVCVIYTCAHIYRTATSRIVPFCGTPKNTIQTSGGVLLKDHTLF